MQFPDDESDEIRRRSSLVMQTLPITLIPIAVSLLTFLLLRGTTVNPAATPPTNPVLPILVLVVFSSAMIVLVRLRRPTISALLLIAVWTMLTVGATLRGGVNSNLVALLIVPICVAGLLIDWVASVSLAALATVLVLSLAWLQSRGIITSQDFPPFPIDSPETISAAFWISLFWTIAALTSLLAGGIQRALRESRHRASELRRLSEQLEARVQAQTAELLSQAQERATLEERTRLAREIHDTLAQGMAGVAVQVGAARQGLGLLTDQVDPKLLNALRENLTLAEEMARSTLSEARRSVWNLRTPLLDRGSLHDALEQVASQATIPTTVQISGEPRLLPQAVEAAFLRITQEGLANSNRHANATQATISLHYTARQVHLQIADDGEGFPPSVLLQPPTPGLSGGFGLLGMRERITALGGTFELANESGAVLRVAVPIFTAPQKPMPDP